MVLVERNTSSQERVVIRHAEVRDADALVALARAVGAEPEGWLITDGTWRSAVEERRYLRAIRRSPHGAVIVAEADHGIVGRLSIARETHPASVHVADVGLMVARDERRRGVGRSLMEAAESWARATDVLKLELHVFPHNRPAIALYEKLGYRQEGLRRKHYRRRGELVDALLMAKELA
jgi:RimJ/RimL family protein N-acetyltransferase